MKIIIIDEINNKSKIIEGLNYNVFNSYIQEKYDYIYNNYIINVMNSIISYGKTNESYQSNLDYTKNKIYEELSDNSKGGPSPDKAKKITETKDVENALTSLQIIANNNYNGIYKLKAYSDFLVKPINFINKVNKEVINIKELISNNKYNDEINLFLNEKIDTLKTRLNNYYWQIYYKFTNIYNLLRNNNSLIYSYLYNSKRYTEWVLNHEYEIINKKTERIDYSYSTYSEKYDNDIDSQPESEHMINEIICNIYNIYEHVEFKLDLILEGTGFKRPKVKGRIVSTSVPKNIEFSILSGCGECCEEGFKYNITLNGLNYTLTVDYNAKTNNIDIKTYTNIEPYNISEIFYHEQKKSEAYEEGLADGSFPTILHTCSKTEKNYTIYYQNTTQVSSEYFENSKNNPYY